MAEGSETGVAGGGLGDRFRHELQPKVLVPNLVAGSVTSVLTVIESVSYATLIFAGTLSNHLSTGIAIALIAAAAGGLVMTLMSSYPGTITVPQNKVAPVLALMAATIAGSMPAGASDEQMLLTVVATIVLSTLATGVFLAGLGVFRLGRLIRFIPYPVIAGFLAGTGWLLLLGSIKAMTGTPVTFSTLPSFFATPVFFKWLPGLAFALVAFVMMHRFKHFLVMPGLMLTAVAIVYGALLATGTSVHEAREAGWLVHTAAEGGLFDFLTVSAFASADWSLVLGQAGGVATILFISVVAVLLNSSALELSTGQEMDLDRELKAAGAANLASGLAGGMIGFTSLTISGLAVKMGVRSRLVGILTALFAGAVLFLGAGVLAYFPEPIIGGLLMFLGFEFLHKWVYETGKELPRTDWVIVVAILAVVGLFGFLYGVLVGVVAAIILFVVKYSRVDVVRHALTGAHHRSNVDRSSSSMRLLRDRGERIHILRLQGFVFFGTAYNLLNQVKARVADADRQPLRFLLFDFREVSGIDASSVVSMIKLRLLAAQEGFRLIFAQLSEEVHHQLERGALFEAEGEPITLVPDLDHGLEMCEDHLLEAERDDAPEREFSLADHLNAMVPGGIDFHKLEQYLVRREVPAGEHVIEHGTHAGGLYFLERGKVTVSLTLPDGTDLRLRKMGGGTVVGELGLYLEQSRTATVTADEPTVVYRLSREDLQTMEDHNPQTAAAFHRFMASLLAQRLHDTDESLKTLLD